MSRKIGFDSNQYLEEQSRYILERISQYDKLYLEFGGKLIGDFHAMRVLPGFDPNAKIKLLAKLKDQCEIIICIYAGDIEKNKMRGDYGVTYDEEVFRMMDSFAQWGLRVNSVVVTRYSETPSADAFIRKLHQRGVQVYKHTATKGYPLDVETIVSERGYGQNPFIETTQKLVVVTAPGPNSGKLATCLSQLYHENQRGNRAGYAKFETFPIWNLPLKHPVNVAYEAATADIEDVNLIDPYHLEKYGESAVNYNRDIEQFPLLRRILQKIYGDEIPYYSPTDMGVNRAGCCVTDDEAVRQASCQEIIRRSFQLDCDYKKGLATFEASQRGKLLMREMQLNEEDREVVSPARLYAQKLDEKNGEESSRDPSQVTAIEIGEGEFVTGRTSQMMTSLAACLLNSMKKLAGLGDALKLLPPVILNPIHELKEGPLRQSERPLDAKEILLALSISAVTNPMAEEALKQLPALRGCQAHCTVIPGKSDEEVCRELGLEMTCDPVFATHAFFIEG